MSFIVIDDDKFSNMLCSHIIGSALPDATVHTFLDPEEALQFISSTDFSIVGNMILLLDINMPVLSGWDVLDRIAAMDESNQNALRIYMFSSSVDKRDRTRALGNKLVRDYIEKPLDSAKVLKILEAQPLKD